MSHSTPATLGDALPTVDLLRIAREAGANFDEVHPQCLRSFSMLTFAKLLKEYFASSETAPKDRHPICAHDGCELLIPRHRPYLQECLDAIDKAQGKAPPSAIATSESPLKECPYCGSKDAHSDGCMAVGEWRFVPGEIDRSKHGHALLVWNDCMVNHETFEMTWPKLVKAMERK